MKRLVTVVGATRGTGMLVTELLLGRGDRVRVAARNPKKARALFGDRVEHFEVDLTRPGPALEASLTGVDAVVFTAGVPPGLARERTLEVTEFGGVVAVLQAAKRARFGGRLLYMTTMGLHRSSFAMRALDVIKWNLVKWRRAAEDELARSGLEVVTVRAGVLTNGAPSRSGLTLVDGDRPVSMSTTVSRADVARVLVAALDAPAPRKDVSVWAGAGEVPDGSALARALAS